MIAKHQEEWIMISEPETIKDFVASFSTKPDTKLSRQCFLFFIVILTASMIMVIQNDRLVQTSYKLFEMKEYASELEKENQTLRVEIVKLKSSERIRNIATNQLGLVLPGTENILPDAENIEVPQISSDADT
jgi:cell division protein FtsL